MTLSTLGNAPIHYTLDGTDPTASSPLYEGVLKIKSDAILKAMAIHSNVSGRIFSEELKFNKASMKPITANQPINATYKYAGASTLVDALRGNNNSRTGRWIAFNGNDMDMTIDLKEPTEISSVSFTANVDPGDWVFDAKGFTVEVSDDNKQFTKVASEEYPAMKATDKKGIVEHQLTFSPVKTRYVRVIVQTEKVLPDWHDGKGKPSFLFVDEIVIR